MQINSIKQNKLIHIVLILSNMI